MCICHSPARPLPTQSVTKQIVHVLGFAIIGSIVILIHTNIDSLSLTVRLKTNKKRLLWYRQEDGGHQHIDSKHKNT